MGWQYPLTRMEWSYSLSDRPETIDDSDGRRSYASPEPQTELTTWIFDEGAFVPSAKLVGERRYSIISDYLGTPIEAYDEEGRRVWARELDIYGRVRIEQGEVELAPFLYQGQYLDTETGLTYNRFRYYSPEIGAYISQDPIRLEAGLTNLYAYVHDVNAWVDPWGLVLIEVAPSTINYSQRTVSEIRVFDINKYEPIRVIEVDGQLVSYDNRRLLAAQNANLGSLTVDLLDKNDIAISKEGKQTTWWQRFQKRYADKRNIKAGGVVPDTGLSEKTIKASLIH